MTMPDQLRRHGDEVLVFDAKGNYECRGVIVGVHRCEPPIYDVQPNRAESLAKRMCGIPASQLRSVAKPFLAYERKPAEKPQHVLDEV
jgi:hypothetical protein